MSLASALGAGGEPSALSRLFSARLDDSAEALAGLGERLRPANPLLFVEQDGGFAGADGAFSNEGGRWIFSGDPRRLRGRALEFRLAPERCVLRQLELPARAGEFLDGVVRAQIDRLTPWRADEAAYGCGAPQPLGADRIEVLVAATKRAALAGLLDLAAESVRVSVAPEGAAPIALLRRQAGAAARRARWRFALASLLALALVAGIAAAVAQVTLGASLAARSDELAAELSARRAALLRREHAADDPAAQALEARKRATPAAVVAWEALSRALPDDAYLTEMRLGGGKLEIAGSAADAASLIKHLERSPHFAHATFAAPTTRGPENRESFRIAAEVAPLNTAAP